jgi:hypothetical protein
MRLDAFAIAIVSLLLAWITGSLPNATQPLLSKSLWVFGGCVLFLAMFASDKLIKRFVIVAVTVFLVLYFIPYSFWAAVGLR